jgi:glycosyltransferase involved in cell wall biosynthesis
MKISVLIPTYNAARTIEAALESVFAQTVSPDEVLVLIDGSTDDTLRRLERWKDKVIVLTQPNSGVSRARNRLVQMACGDMLAFLDSDDIWHPRYLEAQRSVLQKHPDLVASFTGHFDFPDDGIPAWDPVNGITQPTIFDAVSFLNAYNTTTGLFASMSYCCLRRAVADSIDGALFHPEVGGVEDSYLCYRLALRGPVARLPVPLVAYRITEGSLSANRVKSLRLWVRAFELVEREYSDRGSPALRHALAMGLAAKRREYARTLLGAGDAHEARRQLWLSLRRSRNAKSVAKSLSLVLLSRAPRSLQPEWPPSHRSVPFCGERTSQESS